MSPSSDRRQWGAPAGLWISERALHDKKLLVLFPIGAFALFGTTGDRAHHKCIRNWHEPVLDFAASRRFAQLLAPYSEAFVSTIRSLSHLQSACWPGRSGQITCTSFAHRLTLPPQ